MSYTIVRMYETEQQANDAVSKLRSKGFVKDTIFTVTPQAGGTADSVVAALMAAYVLKSHAKVYASGILAGRSLVVVHAPFGSSRVAIETLNSCGPVDSGLRLPESPKVTWDERAPLSSALQAPVLLRNSPAPLSRILGISAVSKSFYSVFAVLFGDLTSPRFSLSSLFGMSLLSNNAAPLSSMAGMKTVSPSAGPWQTSLGMPLLSSRTFSLSGLLGLPLLSRGG